jgi:hypothetical protein
MTAEVETLFTHLFDACETLDRQAEGYGLYAIRDYQKVGDALHPRFQQEWEKVFRPVLQAHGYPVWGKPSTASFEVTLRNRQRVGMRAINLSHVKVRKYGSQHRIDPYHDYAERWDEIPWEKWLWALWRDDARLFRYRAYTVRSLFLIAFDDRPQPLFKEMTALQAAVDWEKHGARCLTREWPDRYGRAIWCKLAAWYYEEKEPASTPSQESI